VEEAMKRFALLALGFYLGTISLARADEWSKTYTIANSPDLRVETSDASIRVDTWDQNTIEARVTTEKYKIGEHGIQVIEHQSGDLVDVEVRYPHDVHLLQFNWRSSKVQIEIHMPRQGRVRLHTGDGSINLVNFKGDMELRSGDGHQDIDSVEGKLQATAGDGHIRAAGRFDGLELNTGDGRIEARVLPGSAITSDWTLHAGDGSVTLQLPEGFAADLDLHTGDGHIDLDLPLTVEGQLSHNNVRGKLNGGGSPLRVHTGDGSIKLEKS
jgi:DUF4097 and DUF4098 domain-containing protein YvlB